MTKSLLEMVEETMPKLTTPLTAIYDTFISNNREHQTRALLAISKADKGQIILPTGTGKTRVQVAMIVRDMIAQTLAGTLGTYVIASHRLLLNKQLMDELLDLCLKCGLPVNALYVGSARHDDKEVYDKYFQHNIGDFRVGYTTSGTEIRSFATETKTANRHLIVVSTYHSFDSLAYLDSIDICAYDEAHNTTEENFRANIQAVISKIKRNYFFTATRKVCTIEGHGMEDEAIYGKVITDSSPTEMINAGEILRPRIITMFLDNDTPKGSVSTSNQHMLVKTITEAFSRSKERVKADSSNPDAIGNKMIVSSEGSDELNIVQESPEFKAWCTANHVRVFSFSSKYGSFIDFEKSDRDTVYDAMKGISDQEDAILLHIDILTEGMDLPAITSILLLRNLNEISLFQTLGRGLRLTKNDRQGLYSGQITKEQFVKRHAYLVLPLHFEKMDTSGEDMKRTIQDVVGTYGIPVEEFLPPEGFKAKKTDALDLVTKTKMKLKAGKDYPLLSVIEDFIIGEVKKGLPKDAKGLYDALMGMFKKIGGKSNA
jgi:superfamily II DNA or RNA helicase